MSQDENDRVIREPAEELETLREPADVESHMRVREPADQRVRNNDDDPDVESHMRVREPADQRVRNNDDDPDVEAHMRSLGPPLIEDSARPEIKQR